MGCKRPTKEGLLGPKRLCLYPKILRSNKVIKAILIKTVISKTKLSIIKKIFIILKKIPSQLQSDALNKL